MTDKEFANIVDSTKAIVLSAIQKNLAQRFYHYIDDVVQETYVRAYRSLTKNKFRYDSKIETWLYTIARNESQRMNSKLIKEEEKIAKSKKEQDNVIQFQTPEFDLVVDELYERISELPEKYSSVLNLVARGYSEKEIANQLDLKPGTVKSRLSRGREMLQKIYQGGKP